LDGELITMEDDRFEMTGTRPIGDSSIRWRLDKGFDVVTRIVIEREGIAYRVAGGKGILQSIIIL